MVLTFTVEKEFIGFRLDSFLFLKTGQEISRTSIQKWIESGNIINKFSEKKIKSNTKVKEDETYEIQIPPKPKLNLLPIQIPMKILYEDDHLVVIDKPEGLACHGGPEDFRPSLVNGLLFHFSELSKVAGEIRPGIVHRLDKPTTGVMVIAKNDAAHIHLSKQFQNRKIEKTYYAWLVQTPNLKVGKIDLPLKRHPHERLKMIVDPKGRKAITNYEVVKVINSKKGRNFTLVKINIETGRTHQIRVHFQHLRCPIVGDGLYSRSANEFQSFGLLLFSQRLKFQHPITNEWIERELEFPERFQKFEENAQFH